VCQGRPSWRGRWEIGQVGGIWLCRVPRTLTVPPRLREPCGHCLHPQLVAHLEYSPCAELTPWTRQKTGCDMTSIDVRIRSDPTPQMPIRHNDADSGQTQQRCGSVARQRPDPVGHCAPQINVLRPNTRASRLPAVHLPILDSSLPASRPPAVDLHRSRAFLILARHLSRHCVRYVPSHPALGWHRRSSNHQRSGLYSSARDGLHLLQRVLRQLQQLCCR
jgi:hypothetical protein